MHDARGNDENGSPPPEELLRRYVQGDELAFTRLVDLIGGRLFGFVQRFVGHRCAAEDVYQSVLIKVATHAKDFDARAQLATWVYRIARNACLDALRHQRRRPEILLAPQSDEDDAPEERLVATDYVPPDQALSAQELGERIQQALQSLPDEQREVFLLKEEGGLTFEDIGRLLGCGKETAKSRMRYALQRLQSALGREAREYGLTDVRHGK